MKFRVLLGILILVTAKLKELKKCATDALDGIEFDDWFFPYLEKFICENAQKLDPSLINLCKFVMQNPKSITTDYFYEYHVCYMHDPKTELGEPDFSYMLDIKFDPKDWVAEEEMKEFQAFVESQK